MYDLEQWQQTGNINLRIYPVGARRTNAHHALRTVLRELKAEYSDSIILLTNPYFRFDERFLEKCRLFAREGKHVYRPSAEQRLLFEPSNNPVHNRTGSIFVDTWNSSSRPMCIHASDLLPLRHRGTGRATKQAWQSASSTSRLRAVYSLDSHLHLDIHT